MKLTVMERIQLQNMLPEKGDYITLKLIRKLRESLSFSEKEINEIRFKTHWRCNTCNTIELSAQTPKCPSCAAYMENAGMVNWDEKKALKVIKDVHMGKTALETCRAVLKKLSDEKALTEPMMKLYEAFCIDVADEEEDA